MEVARLIVDLCFYAVGLYAAYKIYRLQVDRQMRIPSTEAIKDMMGASVSFLPFGRYLVRVDERRGDLVKCTIFNSPRNVGVGVTPEEFLMVQPGMIGEVQFADGRTVRSEIVADGRYLSDEVIQVERDLLYLLEPQGVIAWLVKDRETAEAANFNPPQKRPEDAG